MSTRNKLFHERWKALKCKHTETIPTVLISHSGGPCVCLQCVACGVDTQEIRKSKSDFKLSDLPPFDHEFRDRQFQLRKELSAQMWNEAKE